ncbi:hypothetical protein D3C77_341360 [compost metagenome]
MQLEHERHEVFAGEAAITPVTLAKCLATDRVEVEHRVLLGIGLSAARVIARNGRQQCRMARLVGVLHVPDLQARMFGLDLVHKGAWLLSFTHTRGFVEGRVQPFIQLVMEGQDTTRETGHGQEQGRDQAQVAMQQNVEMTHDVKSELKSQDAKKPAPEIRCWLCCSCRENQN